jgi:hypothetical protein
MGLSGVGILLLPVLVETLVGISSASYSFGGTFWETIFLVEGYLLFVFLSFGSFG